jgi:release factor glutamine methyltransferase
LYLPSDDSILLANCIKNYRGKTALEIGVGSGIITESLSANFEYVIGTDLVLEPLRSCIQNDSRYHINAYKQLKDVNGLELICADAASPFRRCVFDLIVSNPPYLPDDYDSGGKRINDRSVYGGTNGIEMTLHIIQSSILSLKREGSMLIIVSSLSNIPRLEELLRQLNMTLKLIIEKKLFFETLSVVEINFKSM